MDVACAEQTTTTISGRSWEAAALAFFRCGREWPCGFEGYRAGLRRTDCDCMFAIRFLALPLQPTPRQRQNGAAAPLYTSPGQCVTYVPAHPGAFFWRVCELVRIARMATRDRSRTPPSGSYMDMRRPIVVAPAFMDSQSMFRMCFSMCLSMGVIYPCMARCASASTLRSPSVTTWSMRRMC